MVHLIQKSVFGFHHYDVLISSLNRLQLSYKDISIVPMTKDLVDANELPLVVDTQNVFCWGSVKLAHIASNMGWNPGSFFNDNHDYQVYSRYYGDEMLNHDCQIVKFGDKFISPEGVFFARPCGDTKAFTGQCFIRSSWDEFVEFHVKNGNSTLNENTMVQIASRKDIQREFRTWIVAGKVVTSSQYRLGNRTIHERCTEPMVLEYAQRMADIYHPAESFVLDVCMTNNKMKIVEINCINCAGFYDCDLQVLLESLEKNFNQK